MPQPTEEPRTPATGRSARRWAVLSMLGLLAFTAFWLLAVVRLFDEGTFMNEGLAGFYMVHVAFVVVGGWFGWRWWRELLRPDVHRERPPEPDEPPMPHRGLSGEDGPPQRW